MLRLASSLITASFFFAVFASAQYDASNTMWFGRLYIQNGTVGTTFVVSDYIQQGATDFIKPCQLAEHAIGPNDPSPVPLNTPKSCQPTTYDFQIEEWASPSNFVLNISHAISYRGQNFQKSIRVPINCEQNSTFCTDLALHRYPYSATIRPAPAGWATDPSDITFNTTMADSTGAHDGANATATLPVVPYVIGLKADGLRSLPALDWLEFWRGNIAPVIQIIDHTVAKGTEGAVCLVPPVDLTTQRPPVPILQNQTCNSTAWWYSITAWKSSSDFTLGLSHRVTNGIHYAERAIKVNDTINRVTVDEFGDTP